ncbi:FemAB family XrtA/PEP-CTERM system-associated protein [Pelagibius sp. Alg239-R121]|uniref:FemAB family XrtA/PEP-CTERM system-associated protein n=1 Tax=Pelagibius sp. Alg239-R121 TaxID=2993448 RepID=UPI0024A7101E|nr:FemAB family XrtA/PEP-CTERM system-associated protein [Pelagibius sp. Alg239-R121]
MESCESATFFHRAGWKKVVEESFGHDCYFLYAEENGELTGVLPLVHVRSRLFGNALISNAFCVYGGAASSNAEAQSALYGEAEALAASLGVDYLELRLRSPVHADWARKEDLYVTFRKSMDPDPDKNLAAIPRKQRAMVRKGLKSGLVGELDEDTERLHRIYAESVRNLGTPVFSRKYFRMLKEVFGDDCEILTVTHEGRPVAGVMSFYFRDEVVPYYGGGTSSDRKLAINDFMYWDLMRRSCEAGYRVFDFGRSKRGTGAFDFKKHWGFEPEPLVHEFKLLGADALPEVNPTNPKYSIFISAWRKLPLPVANTIGPFISRNLG